MAPRRNKVKPFDPAAAERARISQRRTDFDAVGLQPEAATLASHSDVQTTRAGDERAGKRVADNTARRIDAFEALRAGMQPGVYDAARRLERDIKIRNHENDRGHSMARVDHEGGKDFTDAAIEAHKRVRTVFRLIGARDQFLLSELIDPGPVSRLARPHWRQAVFYVTGETHDHAQGAAVRAACSNLAEAYSALERISSKGRLTVAMENVITPKRALCA